MTKGALRFEANGLVHHVVTWGDARARPLVLIHGYMDAAATWDRVARPLADAGFRVLAPDMRGFGEGPRAPAGSYYHFADYVADVAAILEALYPGAALALAGHSMGGTIATLYAGTFPERVAGLANLEGLGPPDMGADAGPVRMRRWLDDLAELRAAQPMSFEDARRRLALGHPRVAPEVILELVPLLTRDTPEGLVWRVDPLHRTTSPMPFFASAFVAFIERITCPVLHVSGGPLGFHVADEDARLAAFRSCERIELADAGHMMHWTKPTELASVLARFFG